MAKEILSVEEHREIGEYLREIRAVLMDVLPLTPKSEGKKKIRIVGKLDQVRSMLDDAAAREHPKLTHAEFCALYYGKNAKTR